MAGYGRSVAGTVAFEQHMSDQESLMWTLEADPVLRSSFANVTFLDRPVDAGRFRERMRRAIGVVPRLRQRVVETASPGNPSWVDDPLFDLDFQIRSVAVPAPGGDRAVLDLAALVSSDPFDHARPLWQFTLVEGLDGGRGAMIQKLHHSITDGEGGIRLSASFVDLERDATHALASDPGPRPTTDGSGAVDAMRRHVAAGARLPLELTRHAMSATLATVGDPRGAPARAGEALGGARAALRQIAVTEPARSPLWRERSLRRRIEVLRVPLAEAREVGERLGGTVNDWFVTGATGAAGAYHRAVGSPVDELRMAMPVSTRRASGATSTSGANSFTPTRVLVPAGIVDPALRFDAVRSALRVDRGERALGSVSRLVGMLSVLPAPVLTRVARQQVGTVDFTTSNLRGAPFPLYVAGARIEANHPVGPMAGTAFNLTTLSCDGSLDMGCVIDPAAVGDPALLLRCLVEAFAELRDARR